ncbi:cobalamin biosynthesis protein [Nocardia sp. AG03]|uniref:cobalamin biosynthesis protein n=1 Tax=Nocardia sp. AG03 TaxID=3025312 RepID=UPI002418724A|nr:cobalamin biosynthesis protein [Nocardia sp. AG03]
MVGLGLRPGTESTRILRAIDSVAAVARIVGLATLDRRADDTGIRAAADTLTVPLVTFTPAQLAEVAVRHRSARTARAIGADSVAEAAALLAGGGELVRERTVVDGIVVAVATAHEDRN